MYCHAKALLLRNTGLLSQDRVRHFSPRGLFFNNKAQCFLCMPLLPRDSRLVNRLDPRRNNEAHGGDSTGALH